MRFTQSGTVEHEHPVEAPRLAAVVGECRAEQLDERRDPRPPRSSPSSGGVRPVVTQPWPCRTASRMVRGPFAATRNGTRGCCSEPGIIRASNAVKYSPAWSVAGSRSRSRVSTNSTNRSVRGFGASTSPPSTVASTPVPPAPRIFYEAIQRQNAESKLHSEFIGEWSAVHFSSAVWLQALSFRDPASADWWLLAASAVAVILTLARKEIGPAVLLVVGAYASLEHLRLQALFAIIVCVVAGSVFTRFERHAAAVSEHAEAKRSDSMPRSRKFSEWAAVGLLVLLATGRVADLITDRYYLWSDQITLFGTGPSWWFPERATQFLREQHLPGNVFGDYGLGGYLTWRLGPEYPDYFDGRFIPFGGELFARHRTLLTLPLDSPEWQKESRLRNIQTVIFSVARIGGLGNFPLQADCDSRGWRPVYLDDVAVIFLRDNPENADTIRRLGIRCETALITPPAIASTGLSRRATDEEFQFLMNAASIDYVLSRDAEAINNSSNAAEIFSDDPNLHLLKAQLASPQPADGSRARIQNRIATQAFRCGLVRSCRALRRSAALPGSAALRSRIGSPFSGCLRPLPVSRKTLPSDEAA